MKFLHSLALYLGLAITAAAPAGATTISNTATGQTISTFGSPDSQTYGQVFVAPVTGTLDSFTMHLSEGVGEVMGAVGTWNGGAAFGFGFGSDTTLFTSAPTSSGTGGALTFTPGVGVTAGSIYVAFLTVFGLTDVIGQTSMPLGDALEGGGYFVWNNSADTSSPFGNTSWNYFYNGGNALFSASFTAVPLPAGGLLLISALFGIGLMCRRRRF
ncbi:MAG: VPLPA-CTERM sorting domain-containing protein [Rhodobacteraceae bacterium]|nr:VPLPA-CTERM sorting domain-containing protein [Paracoccaceae bacterium]